MSWLMHNPIADMYGPHFLLFYTATIVAVMAASIVAVRKADPTDPDDLPDVPLNPDPYRVAFMRGGANEVTRVAIASLVQRGLLRIEERGSWLAKKKVIARKREPWNAELSGVEAEVYHWPGFPESPQKLFQPNGLAKDVEAACRPYEKRLAEEELLMPPGVKAFAGKVALLGVMVILALGGYKLAVALDKGRTNVQFLLIAGAVGLIGEAVACAAIPRLSRRGKAYLGRLRLAYDGVRGRIAASGLGAADPLSADDPTGLGKSKLADPGDWLLALGLFGIPVVAGTPLADLKTMFSASSSGPGGCGGGGCGGGGCGGGGCGGGGCGGCGGGG
jgi:uncharacterized protein (TIGR04222 family)